MAYATQADIVTTYGEDFLAGLMPREVEDAGGAAAVDQALDDASAEIDGYLSARYRLPLEARPRVLRRPCIDIAAYVLANSHTRLTTTMEERYAQTVRFLTLLSKGQAGLGADEPRAEAEGDDGLGGGSGAAFDAAPRRFGRGLM